MEIGHASEIDEIFDAISYKKGASVIRMLQNYLGAEKFQVCNNQSHDKCALWVTNILLLRAIRGHLLRTSKSMPTPMQRQRTYGLPLRKDLGNL